MPVRVGDPAPPIQLPDHSGDLWRLGEHLGRPVVLIFHRDLAWLPCRTHAAAVRDRLDEFGDAEIAVITFTRVRNLAGYRTRFLAPLTLLADESRQVYDAYGLPTTEHGGDFVIDAEGRLVFVFQADGPQRPEVDELIAAVREAAQS